jgi:hypothetical protein
MKIKVLRVAAILTVFQLLGVLVAHADTAVEVIPLSNTNASSAYRPRKGDFFSTNASQVLLINNVNALASYSWTNYQRIILNSNASVVFRCGGTNAGVDYPQVTANTVLFLGPFSPLASRIELQTTNGFQPQIGDVFTLFRYGTNSGALRTVTVPVAPTGGVWRVTYETGGLKVGLYPDNAQPSLSIPPGDPTNSAQFVVESGIGRTMILDSSTNMVDWVPVLTNASFTGWLEFRRQFGTNESLFYRVRQVNP